jgi:hypothetical protein
MTASSLSYHPAARPWPGSAGVEADGSGREYRDHGRRCEQNPGDLPGSGLGTIGLAADLRDWVNSGLMAFFFLVAGLEARREFDMGELRIGRRRALPLVVGLRGMIVPIGIY